jgi:acetyl-CoA/propionyl-CoA carboxylase
VKEFRRVLIANRGEIAVRVINALETLEIESVAVYSDADVTAMHVRKANKAFRLPGFDPAETYLSAPKIVEIARKADCDAIHPGYGFLSESSDFSKLCQENAIKFVGPSPDTLQISGNKLECKKIVERQGVPVIPYTRDPVSDVNEATKAARDIGFPVLMKSAFGGGGRGIREAKNAEEVKGAFESAEREAKSSFGRFALYIEKELVNPRHIEVQILASGHSSECIHLGERECSIQRRYQKLVELSPSPVLDDLSRKAVTGYAVKAAQSVKYSNAGTVEFLRDSSGQIFFIEVNSRLQVEHPVTEFVTGVDLVRSQLEIAASEKLPFRQNDIHFRGCAIECRINAENPYADFLPTTGKIEYLVLPSGPGIRVDTALETGSEVSPYYDSMLAKLIAFGRDFNEARRRAILALEEFVIFGVDTTIPFHTSVLTNDRFARGDFDTGFIGSSGIMNHKPDDTVPEDHQFALAALVLSQGRSRKKVDCSLKQDSPSWAQNRKERFVDAL